MTGANCTARLLTNRCHPPLVKCGGHTAGLGFCITLWLLCTRSILLYIMRHRAQHQGNSGGCAEGMCACTCATLMAVLRVCVHAPVQVQRPFGLRSQEQWTWLVWCCVLRVHFNVELSHASNAFSPFSGGCVSSQLGHWPSMLQVMCHPWLARAVDGALV